MLVLDIISNLLKSIGDYIKRLPHDGSWKMVLRKICNFAKIAPFQLNIFNVVKRLFYVIFIFLDSSYYKVQHIKKFGAVLFLVLAQYGSEFAQFSKI